MMTKNKEQLRAEALKLIRKHFGKDNKVTLKTLDNKFTAVLEKFTERMSTQLLTKVSARVIVSNLKEVMQEVMKENTKDSSKRFIDGMKEVFAEKPAWYKEPPEKIEVKADPNLSGIAEILLSLFKATTEFFGKLWRGGIDVRLGKDHYLTPQKVVLIDPTTMKPLKPQDIGVGTMTQVFNSAMSAGRPQVGIAGAAAITDGQTAVTTAGTRVQLPNQPCARVFVQAHPANTGDMVIGGITVVADAATRRGLALFATQWQEFQVKNLNQLYIDSTASGDKINYIVEYNA